MDNKVMYQLTYGLFVLTAKDGEKDNGCIINTAMQVTTSPNRVIISVNKDNYTHDMIAKTKEFNVSILTEESKFSTFKNFGFQSGRDVDKFQGVEFLRAENGITYLKDEINGMLSGKVVDTMDMGTHTLFLADVVDGVVISQVPSVTYGYYQKNIKTAPPVQDKKKGYVCKICGFIYEGEPLPEDYICPICKHGAIDFEKL